MKPILPLIALTAMAFTITLPAQILVQPASVTIVGATAQGAGANDDSFIDGDGLSNASSYTTGSPVPVTWDTHSLADLTENGNWRSGSFPPGGTSFTYTMSLGGGYDVTGMHVWNYNATADNGYSSPGIGINRMLVEVSTNGGTTWTTAADYTSGSAFIIPTVNVATSGQTLDFGSTFNGVNTVRFSNMDSFWTPGGGDSYNFRKGIAEVRFLAVPEPTSVLTVSVGLISLALLRRRRSVV